MRVLLLALASLLVSPSASASPRHEWAAAAQRAQVLGSRVTNAALDEAAAYWFDADPNNGRSLQGSGPALAAAIRLARAEALRSGVRPLSAELKRAFRSHYPAVVLNQARWTVATPDSRLGRLLARWPVENGAVTLGEVIVFKTPVAARNPRLMAHELVHVAQYRRLGIDRFAAQYAANRDPFEKEARVTAREVVKG
jgi:hypothetical protein